LWIASENGIDVLDLNVNKLVSFPQIQSFVNKECFSIINDSKGDLWIITQDNVYNIVFAEKGEIKKVLSLSSDMLYANKHVTTIKEINGEIWLGHNGRISKVNKSYDSYLCLSTVFQQNSFVEKTIIHCMQQKNEEVWIGTNRGLYKYDLNTQQLHRYRHVEGDLNSLSQSFITDIIVGPNQEIIIGTLMGINFYDPVSDRFIRNVKNDNNDLQALSCNFINCLLAKDNIIWIGTETGGINILTKRNLVVKSYVHDKNNSKSLSHNPVNSIFEDKDGNLWVGNVEGGLSLKLKNENDFIHFFHDSKKNSLSHNSVSAITEDNNGRLWIATWGKGLNVVELKDLPHLSFVQITTDNTPQLKNDFVGSLCYDEMNNGIWIGTKEGLYFYDISHNKLDKIPLVTDKYTHHNMIGMTIDSKKRLWIGTSKGVLIIHLLSFAKSHSSFIYDFKKYKLDESNSLYNEKINCIYEDSSGTIWLGSDGYGLYKLESDKNNNYVFKNYSTQDGLINNNVYGILEDDNHLLWISTNYGISCFDPHNQSCRNFLQGQGILSNQFYWNAYCKSLRNNVLYFGNLKGLVAIRGFRASEKNEKSKKVFMTKLMVFDKVISQGENQYLVEDIVNAHRLVLHEKDKSFSLSFSALNYGENENVRYFYRLKGFDKRWIETGNMQNDARYTNLDAGQYVFQVKAVFNGRSTESEVTELPIIITPFFYKTWWFNFIVIICIILVIISFYLWRISILQKQKNSLALNVKMRTQELENRTIELAKQNLLLVEQCNQINLQKTQIMEMSQKIQEATEDKINFFTGITHEFRTSITLIVGPIARALKLSCNPEVIEQLQIVERNSKSLLALINQLLDFRKIDSDGVEINMSNNNLIKLLNDVVVPFEMFAKERDIRILKYYHLPHPFFQYDETYMEKVIVNLLSNAIKFTPNSGCVKLYVCSLRNEKNEDLIYICVNDNGIGVSTDELEKIFNRFYQSRKGTKYPVYGQSGTGIGLFLCKNIIEKHGGEIFAKNNHLSGTSFRIILPLEEGVPVREVKDLQQVGEDVQEVKNNVDLSRSKQKIPSITILVVEDNRDMRKFIRSILVKEYHVIEAESGLEALDILSQPENDINFIISDLMMPVMDGLEFSKRIKNDIKTSHIPLLILTAKTSYEKRLESYKVGVEEYLTKPFDEDLLLVRIENILKNRRQYQHSFSINMDVSTLHVEEDSRDKKFMDRVMMVLAENYQEADFEVSKFAEAVGVSKTLLNRKLRDLTGESTNNFIKAYRLNKAKELILINKVTKNLNISEVAYEVGFNDPKYFAKCFNQKFGILPSKL
jgi:signal transduction histidine kinase/ligand-binding sensor domain-containing protein/CheY-like chemotaxis protein